MHGRIVLAPDLDAAIDFANAYAPEHLSVDVEPLEPTVARLRNAGSLFVGPWAPESAGDYATGANHVLPTGGLARAFGRPGGRGVRQVHPGPAHHPRRAWPRIRDDRRDPGRRRGPARPPRRRRGALRAELEPMSPTPGRPSRLARPSPPRYSWEATDEEVAARYGVPVEPVVRFDLNTSPTPPALVDRLLAAGRFETPLSEYPPSDYRRLVEAAAARYGVRADEIIVGAGADEILDIIAKAFLPAGAAAIVPAPTYAMYRVDTEQRGATVIAVPRLGQDDGYALDLAAIRRGRRREPPSSGCATRTTRPPCPSRMARSRRCCAGSPADAAADGREPPVVVLDEAYAEFVGRPCLGLRATYPNAHRRSGPRARPTPSPGCGSASPSPGPSSSPGSNPYRPPGSVSDGLGHRW